MADKIPYCIYPLWEEFVKDLEKKGLVLTEENQNIGLTFFIEGMIRYSLADRRTQILIDQEIIALTLTENGKILLKQ